MALTSKQRAQLRGLAMTEDTIIQIGKGGISENILTQVRDALKARELIKGRVLDLSAEVLSGDFEKLSIHIAHNEDYTTCFTYNKAEQNIAFDRTYSGMRRDAVSQRKMKLENPKSTLKLRLILDKYSAELFVNDGYQTFSATFYTPLEADEIVFRCDGKAVLNIEKYDIQV